MADNQNLLKRLVFLKWAKKIKYKDIAYLSGVSESTIYNFISGRRNYSLSQETINKILKYVEKEQENEEEQ